MKEHTRAGIGMTACPLLMILYDHDALIRRLGGKFPDIEVFAAYHYQKVSVSVEATFVELGKSATRIIHIEEIGFVQLFIVDDRVFDRLPFCRSPVEREVSIVRAGLRHLLGDTCGQLSRGREVMLERIAPGIGVISSNLDTGEIAGES